MALPFQPVPGTVQIDVEGEWAGQLVENKFYAQADNPVNADMVIELANIAADWVGAHMLNALTDAYVHRRVVATDISREASFQSINVGHAGEVGNADGTSLPGNVTVAIHRVTGLSGKKAKSRIYWPGIGLDMTTGTDNLTTIAGTILVETCEQLREAIQSGTTAGFIYGYPQRFLDGVRLAAGNFIQVFGHSLTDFFLDSQRRRLPGRGV